ncbi:uncharacterized protein PV09_02264 [Verruconis gallopava]|uniref:FAD-binding domain-containing protein n=1 Tax=Verruconis gallopava TaxID=253628 RepID=A0A0D2AKT8_9PEZI|nr:uncharacterized protein PV09_02264 [Verruconis gallopava]KIW07423.1 hypothetical protein PV09_02264 [Verruconis gallopava]
MPLTIIVCGGGVAGLAAAGYLRAHHQVTVLERGELDFRTDDYGVCIASNALGLLQNVGFDVDALDAVPMTHLWLRTNQNEDVDTLDGSGSSAQGGGEKRAACVVARKANVLSELLKLATSRRFAGEPARIVAGATVVRVDVRAGAVTTQDGAEFRGDVIVGADGVGSLVRTSMMRALGSPAPPPVKHGLLAFVAPVPVSALGGEPSLAFMAAPEARTGLASFQGDARLGSRQHVLLYHKSTAELQVVGYADEKELGVEFDAHNAAVLRGVAPQRVVDEFEGRFTDAVCRLFSHGPIDAWRVRDLDPLPTWTVGKAVLIGDAAHAATPHAGQGCNIAIEDAEALCYLLRCARDPGPHLSCVLKQFSDYRKPRAEFVARYSRQVGCVQSDSDKARGEIAEDDVAVAVYRYQGIDAAMKQVAAYFRDVT